jgi:hypothetical protein
VKRTLLLVLAGAGLVGIAATPGPRRQIAQPTGPRMEAPQPTAVASPARAGARPIALTLKLHYEMICGRPGRGPLVVTLPRAMHVPAVVATRAVRLQGKPPASVRVGGRAITIGVPAPSGVSCYSITVGTLTATFTPAAGLGAPQAAGTYSVHAQIGSHTFAARLTIR